MTPPRSPPRLRFGPFILDTARVELSRDGVVVPLRPKPFAVLSELARHPGTALSKEALFASVWPGAVVTDDSLTQAVHDVRVALGDEGARWVRTIARHGYRFDADVVDADALPADLPDSLAASEPGGPADTLAALASGPDHERPPALPRGLRDVEEWVRHASWPRRATAALVFGTVVAAVLGAGGGLAGWWRSAEPAPPGAAQAGDTRPPRAPRLSLVVLPLAVEAGAEGDAWFGDALSADLTTELGKYSGVTVISRDTAFTFKGRQVDPRDVARELNVRYIVRGTVRRGQADVRLDLALIDGEDGRQHWAEQFVADRAALRQSLAQVSGAMSRALGVEVYRSEGRRASALRPQEIEADDLAMKGWATWFRGLTRANTFEALDLFESAVARDSNALRGWSGLNLMLGITVSAGWAPDPAAARERQREAIRQMERIDADDMHTHLGRTALYWMRQDFDGLLAYADGLVERFPNVPHGYHQQALARMLLGRFDECSAPIGMAVRLGPRDTLVPYWHSVTAFCHFFARRYAEAVQEAQRAVRANSSLAGPQLILAAALARNGQVEQARKIVVENEQRAPFRIATLPPVLLGNEPRLAEGRERMLATLKELGVR